MRPVEKGAWPLTAGGKKRVFNQWSRAIPVLRDRTGKYCHLCEMCVSNALAIEHIKPRETYPNLAGHWDNFLLICNYCNSHKRETPPLKPYRSKYYWPHLNNTMMVFEYGLPLPEVKPANALTPPAVAKADNLITLYGLNKKVTSTGDSDTRWAEKLEAVVLAAESYVEYLTGVNTSPAAIVRLAKTKGFLSIWLKIFDAIAPVKAALMACPEFHLAATGCFNVAAGYSPVPRNLSNVADPF